MKVLYKDLNPEDKKIVSENKIYETFPSGTFFQRFRKNILELSIGKVRCFQKDVAEDNGVECGSTLCMETID